MVGCPIQTSADQFVFADPRRFSQLITSFFASESLGIPHTLLFTSINICTYVLTYVLESSSMYRYIVLIFVFLLYYSFTNMSMNSFVASLQILRLQMAHLPPSNGSNNVIIRQCENLTMQIVASSHYYYLSSINF